MTTTRKCIGSSIIGILFLAPSLVSVDAADICDSIVGGEISVTAFGADGTDEIDDSDAVEAAFDCVADKGLRKSTVMFPAGNFYFDSKVAVKKLGASKGTVRIVGEGMGVTNLVASRKNKEGILRIETTDRYARVEVEDMRFVPLRNGSGTAFELRMPNVGKLYRSGSAFVMSDVDMLDRKTPDTLNHFDYGVKLYGVQRPRFENVKITGPFGPKVKQKQLWYEMEAIIVLEEVFAPVLIDVNAWGAKYGLKFVSNSTKRTPSTNAGEVVFSKFVENQYGIWFETKVKEKMFAVRNSHVNSSQANIYVDGASDVNLYGLLSYFLYLDDDHAIPFHDVALHNVQKATIRDNIFHVPAADDSGNVLPGDQINIDIHNSDVVIVSGNIFNTPSVVYREDVEGSVTVKDDNMFLRGASMPTPPLAAVTYPNGGETFVAGELLNIAWNDTDPTAVSYYVNLRGTELGSGGLELTSKGKSPFEWTIPDSVPEGKYTIQICRRGGSQEGRCDRSDDTFSIESPDTEVTYPNGGESFVLGETLDIEWNDTDPLAITYYVHLRGSQLENGGLELTSVGRDSFSWTIPDSVPEGKYTIQICRRGGSEEGRCDRSDKTFLIESPVAEVTYPNGDESFTQGDAVMIRWDDTDATAVSYYVNLRGALLTGGGTQITSSATGNAYRWVIPSTIPEYAKYTIQICRRGGSQEGRCDRSDKVFSITE